MTLDAKWPRDVSIFLRTAPGGRHFPVYRKDSGDGAGPDARDRREREERADIVIDLHDVGWPVIRRVAAPLAARGSWYLTETRAFFACRAATWDAKFGDDLPAYCAAVDAAGIKLGGVVVDIGCGTGRALPPLRMAVGPAGAVIALDITPEMLDVARPAATLAGASLVLADARALPFPGRLGRRDLRRRPGQSPAGHRSRPAGTGPGDQARRPARALPPLRPRRARRQARSRALARRTPGGGPAAPVDGGRRLGGDGLRRRTAPLLRRRRTPLVSRS